MRCQALLVVGLGSLLWGGCRAQPVRSEVLGSDTYRVTRRSEFGPSITRDQAVDHARAHAAQEGKELVIVSEQAGVEDEPGSQHTFHTCTLTYRLVEPGDPALEQAAEPAPRTRPLTDDDDLYTKLTKLQAMREQGLITDAEFQRVKAEIFAPKPRR